MGMGGADELIYSQAQVDDMMMQWEKSSQEEIRALHQEINVLNEKLKDQKREIATLRKQLQKATTQEQMGEENLEHDTVLVIATVMESLATRAAESAKLEAFADCDILSKALGRVAKCLRRGGVTGAALHEAASMPSREPPPKKVNMGAVEDRPAFKLVAKVMEELAKLEQKLAAGTLLTSADSPSLEDLAAWSHKVMALATQGWDTAAADMEMLTVAPAVPKWQIGTRTQSKAMAVNTDPQPPVITAAPQQKSQKRNIGLNTDHSGDLNGDAAELAAEWQRRLDELREKLLAQLREAQAQAVKDRAAFEELIKRLEQEARDAERRAADFHNRLLALEEALKSKDGGSTQVLAEALMRSGLSSAFRHSREVFERLYQDALDRMRRYAVQQANFLTDTVAGHCHIAESIFSRPISVTSHNHSACAVCGCTARAPPAPAVSAAAVSLFGGSGPRAGSPLSGRSVKPSDQPEYRPSPPWSSSKGSLNVGRATSPRPTIGGEAFKDGAALNITGLKSPERSKAGTTAGLSVALGGLNRAIQAPLQGDSRSRPVAYSGASPSVSSTTPPGSLASFGGLARSAGITFLPTAQSIRLHGEAMCPTASDTDKGAQLSEARRNASSLLSPSLSGNGGRAARRNSPAILIEPDLSLCIGCASPRPLMSEGGDGARREKPHGAKILYGAIGGGRAPAAGHSPGAVGALPRLAPNFRGGGLAGAATGTSSAPELVQLGRPLQVIQRLGV